MSLNVENVDVAYGDLQVLWGVSLEVKSGELVALIGSNGAGKTTTLKTIMGILSPKSGNIKYLESDLLKLKPYERVKKGIAIVPEGRRLFPYMSVLDNILVGAYSREAREKLKDNLEWVFSLFPILKERKDQLASTLSGGEQQMLNIARSLISKPKLIMFDELSFGLAPIVVSKLIDTVHRLNKEEHMSVLLVEQNVRNALEIADYGYVLENGRVMLKGEAKDLLASEYVKKAFLGAI
jgi:branched-chain amino acid transport system ATP-binding protein